MENDSSVIIKLNITKRDDLNGERNTLPYLQLPRTECLESLCCNVCLQTLRLAIERVQSCMTVCVLILFSPERGHSVLDIHLF